MVNSIKTVLTTCPHCFNTMRNEYSQVAEGLDTDWDIEVLHYTEFVDRLISEGRLSITGIDTASQNGVNEITYHDSCYLGRHNDIYDQPRAIADAVPGVEVREMSQCRSRGFLLRRRRWKNVDGRKLVERVNHIRTDHFLETDYRYRRGFMPLLPPDVRRRHISQRPAGNANAPKT